MNERRSRSFAAVPGVYAWEDERTPPPGALSYEQLQDFRQRRASERIQTLGNATIKLESNVGEIQRRIANLETDHAHTKTVLADIKEGQGAQLYMIKQVLDLQQKQSEHESKAKQEANADRRVRTTAFISLGSLITAIVFGLITAIGRCQQ